MEKKRLHAMSGPPGGERQDAIPGCEAKIGETHEVFSIEWS